MTRITGTVHENYYSYEERKTNKMQQLDVYY